MTIPDVLAAAGEVEAFCTGRRWRFCFIGGVAVQRWGNPRFTQDVDVTVLSGLGSEEVFIDAILSKFAGRIPDAREFAIEHRVLLARTASGIDLDFALGAFPFEETSIARATMWRHSDDLVLTTCSAEDLLILKVFAGRDRDWSDVEGVLSRQNGRMDMAYVRRQLPSLLEIKDDEESLEKFNRMVAKIERRGQENF